MKAATLMALAGCTGGAPARLRPARMTFDEFVAQAYLEPWGGGVWIVDGDTPALSLEALRAIYDRLGATRRPWGTRDGTSTGSAELSVHTIGGRDGVWDPTQKRQLSDWVSRAFGSRDDQVVATMEESTRAWESAVDVRFVHVAAEDGRCDATNEAVVFDVNPVDAGGEYLARAFFPGDARPNRNLVVDATAWTPVGGFTITGILRHELGHVLGFRHEHTRPEAGACFEDSSYRPLTPYDRDSVMHYPHCNGNSDTMLALTALDIQGAQSVYGMPSGSGGPTSEESCMLVAPRSGSTLEVELGGYEASSFGLEVFGL